VSEQDEQRAMTIIVCPLSKVTEIVAMRAPERVVSVLDPDFVFPELGDAYRDRHLRLRFHDIHVPTDGQVLPSQRHARALIGFLGAWDRSAPILIHCRAGVGRSTATAFITACLHNPGVDELVIARTLRGASPLARPNETLIALADAVMNRNGRMLRAIADTGRGLPWIEVDENEPFEMPSRFREGTH
jgi:predicted protein tyrosine phosphatase